MSGIAYLVSSALEMELADGTRHPTGYFAEEALKPYQQFVEAGFDVTVVTVDGKNPAADPYGLRYIFHYPDADVDYFYSVTRGFARNPEDVRITLHHITDLGLMAARRIALTMIDRGTKQSDAHQLVKRAAYLSWRQDQQLQETMIQEGLMGMLSTDNIHAATADLIQASTTLADQRKAELRSLPGFTNPVNLSSLTDTQIASFDGVFAPGGHGPMVDLADNDDVGRLLTVLHQKESPIAALCHGPAMLLSAPEREDGQWLFEGYRLTAFTDEEEDQTEPGKLGLRWYLETALKDAGAVFDDGPSAWNSHVVVDRNLVTGQNPNSTEAVATAFVKKLSNPTRGEATPLYKRLGGRDGIAEIVQKTFDSIATEKPREWFSETDASSLRGEEEQYLCRLFMGTSPTSPRALAQTLSRANYYRYTQVLCGILQKSGYDADTIADVASSLVAARDPSETFPPSTGVLVESST